MFWEKQQIRVKKKAYITYLYVIKEECYITKKATFQLKRNLIEAVYSRYHWARKPEWAVADY